MYEKYVKRLLDVIGSGALIIILSPLLLIISFMVYINMGKPVLFKQERIGKGEKRFVMCKFRTMKNATTTEGNIEDDHKRLTKLGIFLRSASLDELPELYNIFKGDMSFVGPRPFPSYYLPYYTSEERRRHAVRAGLIPCDGILGKADDTWEEQFAAEQWYVDNVSFGLDIKIVLITIKLVFERFRSNYGAIERPLLNEVRERNDQQNNSER